MKYVSHKKTNTTRFHIYEVSSSAGIEIMVVVRDRVKGKKGNYLRYDLSDWQEEKVLEICCITMDK